ncbi:heterokaryon incompatibility protein [Colletotrichum kahawae]|uniref:Heterokaryon incompatibility protein n=1 Tax=Colletotrichum kahawae TaxID=34407 RepID=A0AAD9XY93_COLKA|nr:heterokaryon incompatibility protein [Colletotrichum kahawae]
MRHIYANAACNIAASASDNADGGLFRSRNSRDFQPGVITSTLASGRPETFFIFDKGYWDRHLLGGPLHRRGWVFQERFLGPRQLYFTRHQVMWECLEGHKCEGFPRGIPLHDSFKVDEGTQSGEIQTQGPDDHFMPFDTLELWCNLITAYSQCYFTKPEDKLYAFSGIAKLFQEVSGDRYLAGVWRSRVLYLLNWSVFTPKPKLSAQYRALSWSWASVDGPFKMHTIFGGYNFQATVLEVKVTTKTGGQDVVDVTGGFIKLRGPLITGYYSQQQSAGSDGRISIQLKDGDTNSWTVLPFPDTTEIQFQGRGMIKFLVPSAEESKLWSRDESTSKVETEIFCIILAPISELDRVYKRTGWFHDRHRKSHSQVELFSAFRENVEDIIII